tara:strand:+ start:5418 stop:6677 length:1260 start_codon:yes stop_codon:yes gene_type:complete
MKLRPYQEEISEKAVEVLKKLNIVYLSMEVRTGKTLTALHTVALYGSQNALFLTKKKAIKSIESDYTNFGYNELFKLTVINNESAHKYIDDYDFVISDEHHRNGAFPKPNKMTKFIKKHYSHLPMIFLSGTPHPESYSQIYHQFWLSDYSPFLPINNFYKWAKLFVNVKDRHLGYAVVKDYSDANYDLFKKLIRPYFITFTQKDAGFETEVKENIIKVKMNPLTYQLAKKLQKDKLVIAKNGKEIIADTAVKEMQKLHQIYSGTVLFEDKTSRIFDLSKVEAIKYKFKNKKIAIFYKFKAEYKALKQVFSDYLTDDLETFNNTDKNIALQIVSGSEGISLKEADFLVYYNIDFSSKNYWQSRDRLTTMQRKSNDIYWIFSEDGIEEKIYKQVLAKKSYTLNVFKKDYDIPRKDNKTIRR